MRIYAGTLYTIENEYAECVESIRRQTYPHYDHFVFANLPNKLAHTTLFRSFLDRAEDYELLVKVDADMVLLSDALFANIAEIMTENAWAEILTIQVLDFFANTQIWGLNAYRNTVHWKLDQENLFVDIPAVPEEKYLKDSTRLAPAAIHCKNPSPFQAFHYGVHRGLKVVQPGRCEIKQSSSITHWSFLRRVYNHFRATHDTRIGLAALGAEMAFTGRFTIDDLDYTSSRMRSVLSEFEEWNADQLARRIAQMRMVNFGFLPGNLRRKIICQRYRSRYGGSSSGGA